MSKVIKLQTILRLSPLPGLPTAPVQQSQQLAKLAAVKCSAHASSLLLPEMPPVVQLQPQLSEEPGLEPHLAP